MINGSEQRVPVTSVPPGAAVIVNGIPQGVTPLGLDLTRRHKAPVIRIESPGYDPVEIRVVKKVSGLPFLFNILAGFAPAIVPAARHSLDHHGEGFFLIWSLWAVAFGAGLTVFDTVTGTINEFDRKEIVVTLKKADGPTRVETILMAAEDFRNIKWLRIRTGSSEARGSGR
jgi:hypothetical protein